MSKNALYINIKVVLESSLCNRFMEIIWFYSGNNHHNVGNVSNDVAFKMIVERQMGLLEMVFSVFTLYEHKHK